MWPNFRTTPIRNHLHSRAHKIETSLIICTFNGVQYLQKQKITERELNGTERLKSELWTFSFLSLAFIVANLNEWIKREKFTIGSVTESVITITDSRFFLLYLFR